VDPLGWAYFTGLLLAGGTVEQVTAVIVGSPESLQNRGGTNAGFLQAFYQDTFHRSVDPLGQSFADQLIAAGQSRAQVASALLDSDEYRQDWVEGVYETYLERTADSLGQTIWPAYLKGA
jgi:hypothetical protein